MPVSTPKYKNLFCQTLKKQVLIRGFLLYCLFIMPGVRIMEESTEPTLSIQNQEPYKTPFCTNSALFGDNVVLLWISTVGTLYDLVYLFSSSWYVSRIFKFVTAFNWP